MIDPISAFSMISSAAGAISGSIKAGKDLSSLSGPISRYAKAEAQLNFGAARKKKSLFSKMTGAEQAGIDEFFRKEELDQMRKQMREIFMKGCKLRSPDSVKCRKTNWNAVPKCVMPSFYGPFCQRS
jgi:hypothetical protein